jgi:hypothetical protein
VGILGLMNTRATVVLAFAAGLTGGIVSQRIINTPIYAQVPTPTTREIRAEKFVLVDDNGLPRGAFGIGTKDGWPTLEVTDKKGYLWRARLDDSSFGRGKTIRGSVEVTFSGSEGTASVTSSKGGFAQVPPLGRPGIHAAPLVLIRSGLRTE